ALLKGWEATPAIWGARETVGAGTTAAAVVAAGVPAADAVAWTPLAGATGVPLPAPVPGCVPPEDSPDDPRRLPRGLAPAPLPRTPRPPPARLRLEEPLGLESSPSVGAAGSPACDGSAAGFVAPWATGPARPGLARGETAPCEAQPPPRGGRDAGPEGRQGSR